MLHVDSDQGSKMALVRLYLRVPQAAGQVEILIFLGFFSFLYLSIIFVMQGMCLFSDISRPADNAPASPVSQHMALYNLIVSKLCLSPLPEYLFNLFYVIYCLICLP